MHIPTHILSGWCLAEVSGCSGRERLFAVLAAIVPDVDGLSLFWGKDAYLLHHHTYGHSLFFGLSASSVLCVAAGGKIKSFVLFLALFHLHLLMDSFGSGIGWGIAYGWPFEETVIENPWAWHFASWQNYTTALFFGVCAALSTLKARRAAKVGVSP